jgi:hypothetical protein
MTQHSQSKYAEFVLKLNDFKLYLHSQTNYVEEDVALGLCIKDFFQAVNYQSKYYQLPDYKVKFLEWVLQEILNEIDQIEFNDNKRTNKEIQRRYKNHIRVAFLEQFATELQLYPFLFNEFDQINWKWKYREVLVYLYGLKQLGAFQDDTADQDISILKDVIFRTGKFHWENNDVLGSLKDIKAIYQVVSNWQNKNPTDLKKFNSKKIASYQHAFDSFNEINGLFESYEDNVRSKQE